MPRDSPFMTEGREIPISPPDCSHSTLLRGPRRDGENTNLWSDRLLPRSHRANGSDRRRASAFPLPHGNADPGSSVRATRTGGEKRAGESIWKDSQSQRLHWMTMSNKVNERRGSRAGRRMLGCSAEVARHIAYSGAGAYLPARSLETEAKASRSSSTLP